MIHPVFINYNYISVLIRCGKC